MESPCPPLARPLRRSLLVALASGARWLLLALLRLCARPFRPLPRANIGLQLTLLSLVTTVPFIVLIIAWSVQDTQNPGMRPGMVRTAAGAIWATLAAIGLGVLSHRRLSLPIEQLSRTAQQIGQGDFTARTPFQRADELGELGTAMNAMAANVQQLTGELRATRDQLVQTIAEMGRLATSDSEAEALWPLLTEIIQRLTAADGSALYLREGDGSVRLGSTSGRSGWPGQGRLVRRLATQFVPGVESEPLRAEQRMAIAISVGQKTAAYLEVYREGEPFAPDASRLLSVFAHQAGLAIERTYLIRQAAEALAWEQTSQTQGEFIALASHELCAPVASLRSYAEALRRPDIVADEAERQYGLERIEHLSGRLGDIVRNLLSVSRIRSGQLQVRPDVVALDSLVRGCVSDVGRREPEADIAIAMLSDLPPVLADPVCLEEILMNLLGNALRYAPGSPVRVSAEAVSSEAGSRIRLHVRDEGPGLSVEQQRRLFQRFGGQDAIRPGAGLGLGLYICQTYAQLLHGRIWVESTPGQGATFSVELPAAMDRQHGEQRI